MSEALHQVKNYLLPLAILAGCGFSVYSIVFGSRACMAEKMSLSRTWQVKGCLAQLLGIAWIYVGITAALLCLAALVAIYGQVVHESN
jgi:hypothetical protein